MHRGKAIKPEEEKFKLVKVRPMRLARSDDAWEADFPALPRSITQSGTDHLATVVPTTDDPALAGDDGSREGVGRRPRRVGFSVA
jgi:hypothetical protein